MSTVRTRAPFHRRLRGGLAALACLVLPAGLVAADQSPPSLLEAYLQQAPRPVPLAAPASREPVPAAAGAAGAELPGNTQAVSAAEAWKTKPGREALLTGIAPEIRAQARQLAADEPALKQALAAGPALPLVLALVAERSPAVLAADRNWRAELARFSQADYLQDLLRRYRGYVREIDTAVGPNPLMMDEGGLFAGADVLSLKGRLIDQSVAIAARDYELALRMALSEAAGEYFNLQFDTRALAILETNRVLAAQMNDSAQAQLKAGRVTQADVLKTRTLLDLLDNRIAAMRDDRRPTACASLNGLLALPPDTPWGVVPACDLGLNAPAFAAVVAAYGQNNQDHRRADLEAERMATMLRMAELMLAPGSSGRARIDLNRGAEAGPTRNDMAAFPTMPAAMAAPAEFSSNLAYLEELRFRTAAMRQAAVGVATRGAAAARGRLHAVSAAARTLQTLDTTVPQARQAFDIVKANYAAGNAPLVEFLDAGHEYFDQTLMREDARLELNLSWVALQEILGTAVTAAPVRMEAPAHD